MWNAGTPVDPGPDRGRIEGRSRGPSRTALRSAPVDIEREIKALRQSTLLAPRHAARSRCTDTAARAQPRTVLRAARRCRCALDVTPGGYSLVIRTRAHSTLETARFTVFRAKFFALSRVGILDTASLSELLSRPPSPTAHAAAQRRQGTTTAGHASKRQTRFTGASPSLRPLVAA